MVPIRYNIRSLAVRKVTTLATAVGIVLVVWVFGGALMAGDAVKQAMIDWWGPVVHEYFGSTETGIPIWHSAEEALATLKIEPGEEPRQGRQDPDKTCHSL